MLIALFWYSSFPPPFILWIWNLVILTVIHLTNTKLFRLRLPILPILKKRRPHSKILKVFNWVLVYRLSRCILRSFEENQENIIHVTFTISKNVLKSVRWNRTKEVDRTVNATNRSGTESFGWGPLQFSTQNESQSVVSYYKT